MPTLQTDSQQALPPVGELPRAGAVHGSTRLALGIDRGHVERHWPLCGAIADYVALFILHGQGRSLAMAASMVINELVENAVKYAAPRTRDIAVEAWGTASELTLQITHPVTEAQAEALLGALHRLREQGTEAMIEANAAGGNGLSGLGLVTLVREHGVIVGASTQGSGDALSVVVQAVLPLDEVSIHD